MSSSGEIKFDNTPLELAATLAMPDYAVQPAEKVASVIVENPELAALASYIDSKKKAGPEAPNQPKADSVDPASI